MITNLIKKIRGRITAALRGKPVAECLSSGLMSRGGAQGFELFQQRISAQAPLLLEDLSTAQKNNDFSNIPEKLDSFLNATLDRDIVDVEFPACRTVTKHFKSSFAQVKMLCSIADYFAFGRQSDFFKKVIANINDKDYYWNAYARLLLRDGKYREAADAALEAKRCYSYYDLCLSRIVIDTQKALLLNGIEPDYPVNTHDYSDRFCDVPFLNWRLLPFYKNADDVITYICYCASWLPVAFSNQSWNSEDMQEIRRSILDGSFKYCNESLCLPLKNLELPKRSEVDYQYLREIIDGNITEMPKGPERLHLSHDMSCNISCPCCRTKPFKHSDEYIKWLDLKIGEFTAPLLPDLKSIHLSQSGEALASKHGIRFLKSLTPSKYPNLKIELLTNMTLVSPETWDNLGEAARNIKRLHMSIDGASKETLEKLRRGLKWPRLMDALKFVRRLRKEGKLEWLFLMFILQKDNYTELQALLDLASEYCIDEIMIAPLGPGGAYPPGVFDDVNIYDSSHPLFNDCKEKVMRAKAYHKEMQSSRSEIEAAGRSVPEVAWRVF